MRARAASPEVYIAEDEIVKVGREDIAFLKARVIETERRRVRLCAHRDVDEKLHEMFIVLARDCYIRPHKHLNKAESLHVVEGAASVVFLDDAGGIAEVIALGEYVSGRRFYYRIDRASYHTLLIESDVLVFHETVQGPFVRSDTVYAPWAPGEVDRGAADEFTTWLRREAAAVTVDRAKP